MVTDASMPGMSGSELIRKVRKIRPTLPILLVSGYLGTAVVRRAREAGADEVLKKPLSARELATSLDRVLHRTTARGQNETGIAALAKPAGNGGRRAARPRARAQPARRR